MEEKTLKADFTEHKTCIFGIQEGGKTYWAKHIAGQQFKKPIVFQVNADDNWNEIKNMIVYVADRKNPETLQQDFKLFIKKCHQWAIEGKIDAIIIDEADLFIQNNFDLPCTLR